MIDVTLTLNILGAAPKIGQDFKPEGGTIQSKNYPDNYPNYDNQVLIMFIL